MQHVFLANAAGVCFFAAVVFCWFFTHIVVLCSCFPCKCCRCLFLRSCSFEAISAGFSVNFRSSFRFCNCLFLCSFSGFSAPFLIFKFQQLFFFPQPFSAVFPQPPSAVFLRSRSLESVSESFLFFLLSSAAVFWNSRSCRFCFRSFF